MRTLPSLASLFLLSLSATQAAQTVSFWSASGSSQDLNDALNGATIFDHLGSSDYSGYIGELILMPTEPAFLSEAAVDARGMAIADSDGTFAGTRGFVGFCIDSETNFEVSSDLSVTYNYQPMGFSAAENRYSTESVNLYVAGGLKRAAYLLENYFDAAQGSGSLGGASLQAGIWGTLYDLNPDLSTGIGNYYIRNNVGITQKDGEANEIISRVNTWYAEAEANNWGGADYNPDENVLFWIDPEGTQENQSIMTLRTEGIPFDLVPEPGVAVMMIGGLGLLTLSRRRP
jgi:hypothetical protein